MNTINRQVPMRHGHLSGSAYSFAMARKEFFDKTSAKEQHKTPRYVSSLPYLATAIGIFICMLTLLIGVHNTALVDAPIRHDYKSFQFMDVG